VERCRPDGSYQNQDEKDPTLGRARKTLVRKSQRTAAVDEAVSFVLSYPGKDDQTEKRTLCQRMRQIRGDSQAVRFKENNTQKIRHFFVFSIGKKERRKAKVWVFSFNLSVLKDGRTEMAVNQRRSVERQRVDVT